MILLNFISKELKKLNELPILIFILIAFNSIQLRVLSGSDFNTVNLSTQESNDKNKKTLKFENFKEILFKNNKDILSAESKVTSSNLNLKSLQSKWYPRLSLNSSGSPKYVSGFTKNNLSNNTSSKQLQNNISANFEWEIYNPSRIPDIKEGFYNLEISKLDLEKLKRDLYLETISQYFLIKKIIQDINISKEALKVSKVSLSEAEEKLEAGIGNKLEVLEAKTQLKRDQLSLIKKMGELKKEKRNLKAILNLNEKKIIDFEDKPYIMGFWSSDIKTSIKNALNHRISLKRLKLLELANKQKANSIIGGKKPTFSFYNNYSFQSSNGELNVIDPNHLSNSQNETNTLGIKFNWLLFDGGNLKYNYKSLNQRQQEYIAEYEKEEQTIIDDIKNKYIDVEMSIQNIYASYEQVESARESLKISTMRLKAGVTTQREVVNNIRDLVESEGNLNQSITDYNLNLFSLQRKTGQENIIKCNSAKDFSKNKIPLKRMGAELCLKNIYELKSDKLNKEKPNIET